MNTADTSDDRPLHEIRVVLTEHGFPRSLIRLIVHIHEPEERRAEQTGDVRVVHDIPASVPVDFVRIDLPFAVRVQGRHAPPIDCFLQLLGKDVHLVGELVFPDCRGDRGRRAQILREHHVRGDKTLVDVGVVGRSECGADESAATFEWVPLAVVGLCAFAVSGHASGCVGTCDNAAVGGVGSNHHGLGFVEDGFHGVRPLVFAEEVCVFGRGVVVVRYFQVRSQRVKFVLALEDGLVAVRREDSVRAGGAVDRGRQTGLRRWLEGLTERVFKEIS